VPHVLDELATGDPLPTLRLVSLIFKEGFVGLMIGILYGIPFWGAEAAGDTIDLQRGAASALLVDPSSAAQSSVTGTLLTLLLIMLFVLADGFHIVLGGLYDSYRIWRVRDFLPAFDREAAFLFLALLDRVMRIALLIAGPLIIAMFLGDLTLALIARFAPQLNVFDIGLSVKSLVLALLLPIYVLFLVDHSAAYLAPLRGAIDELRARLP
jgi:type III secretion protein T